MPLDNVDAIYDKEGKHIGFLRRTTVYELKDFIATDGCRVPDATERNEGKRILQTQQNITCRLESLEQLLIKLQADMQFYSPRAAKEIRALIAGEVKEIKNWWLEDTRRAVSHSGAGSIRGD